MALDFRGKVIIVTGAVRSICKEHCNYFTDKGAQIIVIAYIIIYLKRRFIINQFQQQMQKRQQKLYIGE
ncbi:unnamed protein product [Paramecium sonneborni]|uniref:Uncharacterized protein n=1 Tax=Paramecium sonneborni TaxID=65129 RepID=A0A8S1PYQ1_9CILI|nr:unnamed protein product [Paramecium sonneborni]